MTPLRVLREAVAIGARVAMIPADVRTDLAALFDQIRTDARTTTLHQIAVDRITQALTADDLRGCPVAHVDRLMTFTNHKPRYRT